MTTVQILSLAMAALIAVALFTFVKLRKTKPLPKLRRTLQLFGMVCAIASILALCVSFYYSRDATQLFKIAIPVCILILLLLQNRGAKTNS